jgi:hypothetical protein
MKLTDEQIAALRDDMKPGFYIPPWDIPLPATILAIATEVLESRAEIARLTKERDEARKWERLHEVELNRTMLVLGHRFTLVPPDGGDVRPREAAKSAIDALAAAEARVAELEALLDVDRLTDIITDSIDLDWTPRDAAQAIVRAMGGDGT